MAEINNAVAWGQTSSILSMIYNMVPGRSESDCRSPDEFNPTIAEEDKVTALEGKALPIGQLCTEFGIRDEMFSGRK